MATSALNKFKEGDIALFYDPAKTKVGLECMILKVVPEKDDYGLTFFKYFVHFKGWSPERDQYVTENSLLKYTVENRNLQKKHYEELVHSACRHLYRNHDDQNNVVMDGESLNPELHEDSTNENVPELSDMILLPKRKLPKLDFPDNLKLFVEYTCRLVYSNHLVRLPCQPNVVTLLENYLKYLARTNFSNCSLLHILPKKGCHAQKVFNKTQIEKHYIICIEVLDSLRRCFNNFLFTKLLINESEKAQYHKAIKMFLKPPVIDLLSHNGEKLNLQNNVPNEEEKDHLQIGQEFALDVENTHAPLRETRSFTKFVLSKITSNEVSDEFVSKADAWRAVAKDVYFEEIKQPSIIYGIHHLLRLLDNLPKILEFVPMEDDKRLVIYSFSNELLRYLSTQTQLFE